MLHHYVALFLLPTGDYINWDKKTVYERIIDRWKEMDTDYGKANANRGVITDYFRSDELVDTDDKGNLLGQNIYNGSGPWFSRMMATGFQGSLVSKNIPWIRYQMEQFELKGIDELDIWLQEVKKYMSYVYQYKSNFYDVQPQFTHDGLTTGSPVMFGVEDVLEKKIMWMPQHFSTVRCYYDKFNEIEGVIIKDKTWTAKKIFDTFVKEDDDIGTKRTEKLNIAVNQALTSGQLNETFVVYRATFKVNDPIWDSEDNAFKKPTNQDYKWLSVYFLELTDADKRDTPLNDNIGDFTQPFSIWNFDKKPWEATSRTPAFYAIWDNISLQQIDKNYLEDIQNVNRRAFYALDTMRNKMDLSPEGEMYVSSEEYDRPPKFMDKVAGLQFSKELMELKVDALKRWFYIDQLQMFTDLVKTNKAPIAEVHIWQMVGEKSTYLSPAIETHSRYLDTNDTRMVDIEVRAGRGPFDPDTMANITDIVYSNIERAISKIGIQPVYIGRLAQAQKASQALEPITSTMQTVAPLFNMFPNLPLMYREYDIVDDIHEALDFSQKNVVSKEEYEKAVAARNQQIAQEKAQMMAIEMAKASKSIAGAAKDVSGPVDEKSILANAAGGAG